MDFIVTQDRSTAVSKYLLLHKLQIRNHRQFTLSTDPHFSAGPFSSSASSLTASSSTLISRGMVWVIKAKNGCFLVVGSDGIDHDYPGFTHARPKTAHSSARKKPLAKKAPPGNRAHKPIRFTAVGLRSLVVDHLRHRHVGEEQIHILYGQKQPGNQSTGISSLFQRNHICHVGNPICSGHSPRGQSFFKSMNEVRC